jgi:hypothetical protein
MMRSVYRCVCFMRPGARSRTRYNSIYNEFCVYFYLAAASPHGATQCAREDRIVTRRECLASHTYSTIHKNGGRRIQSRRAANGPIGLPPPGAAVWRRPRDRPELHGVCVPANDGLQLPNPQILLVLPSVSSRDQRQNLCRRCRSAQS